MSFGKLFPAQKRALRKYVHGRVVYDLGSGDDLELAKALVDLRAKEVVAIDYLPTPWFSTTGYGPQGTAFQAVRYLRGQFHEFEREPIRTAFVSWPSHRPNPSLLRLVKKASVVILLTNTLGGAMCGDPPLYEHLSRRKVLEHVPNKENTLIVYGGHVSSPRELLPEEIAGIDLSKIYEYKDFYSPIGLKDIVP